jgi:hypothetical protein
VPWHIRSSENFIITVVVLVIVMIIERRGNLIIGPFSKAS